MGRFDEIERKADYGAVERIGDSHQYDKLPKKRDVDMFKVKRELDTVNPDLLMNQCKNEPEGRKHQLLVFYTTKDGENKWIRVAMPKYRLRKYNDKNYFEVVDCRTGKRKTFRRTSVRTVKKCIERTTGQWTFYHGTVDTARFK